MDEYSNCCDTSHFEAGQEACCHCQPMHEIVHAIGQQVQIPNHGSFRDSFGPVKYFFKKQEAQDPSYEEKAQHLLVIGPTVDFREDVETDVS